MEKEKRYLKLEELENGGFYKCRLSGLCVLVNISFLENGSVNCCVASYYEDKLGYYDTMIPSDYQLEKI